MNADTLKQWTYVYNEIREQRHISTLGDEDFHLSEAMYVIQSFGV